MPTSLCEIARYFHTFNCSLMISSHRIPPTATQKHSKHSNTKSTSKKEPTSVSKITI